MRKRLFDSFVDDLRELTFSYRAELIGEDELIREAEAVVKILKTFSSDGEVQNVLSRAEIVILDGVCRDVGMEFANSSRLESKSN